MIVTSKRRTKNPNLTVKIYAGSGDHFTLRKADLEIENCILAYVWDADLEPEVYFATPQQALQFLGTDAQKTKSWTRDGYYKWSSASGLPSLRKRLFVESFGGRWDWVLSQIGIV